MEKKLKSLAHFHTENSRFDSAAYIRTMCERAKELGCENIAISEHGVLTSTDEFMDICSELEMNGIPGVEAYVHEDETHYKRAHLLLYPKNYDGYIAICKAVTAANERIEAGFYPCMNLEILKKYFGLGTKGHGNVFSTSACISGVLAQILLNNETVQKEIDKLAKKTMGIHNPNSPEFLDALKEQEENKEQITFLSEAIKETRKLTKIPTKSIEKKIEKAKSIKDANMVDALSNELKEKKETMKKAEEDLTLYLEERKTLQARNKKLKVLIDAYEKDKAKAETLQKKYNVLKSQIKTEEELEKEAETYALQMVEIFGKDNFFAEIQNHGMFEEAVVFQKIIKLARKIGLPIIAANDAHMATNSQEELEGRAFMRSLRFNKWEEPSDIDRELYIKNDQELRNALLRITTPDVVDEAMENITNMTSQCHVVFEKKEHYPKYQADNEGETANEALERFAYEGIEWRFPNKKGWTEAHQKRLDYELDVIKTMGYSDYHLIVQDFLAVGRKLGQLSQEKLEYVKSHIYEMSLDEFMTYINENATDVGLAIGPGRGSAAGSLVCFLIGITSIDPMKYDLLFERFLNVERVSMPDIDSDFKTDVRGLVLEYVKKRYGTKAVCCIMTKGRQIAKGSIRNAARLLGSKLYNDTDMYLSLGDTIAKEVPNDLHVSLKNCAYDSDTKDEEGNVIHTDGLLTKFKYNPIAIQIIKNAMNVEGRFTNYGMHAAGVIIADNGDVREYGPLMWNKDKKQWMIQCDMVQSEAKGLLKMDFLGLRNLDIITDTLKMVEQKYKIRIDAEKLPIEKDVLTNIFSQGLTNSVFQFESGGMKDMLKRFQPSSFEDLILLVAAYRPGPMQYLDDIIKIKHGKKDLTFVTPELKPILSKTYGAIIYQEQVQQIFQKLAGYSLGQADLVRRAMSKKKEKVLALERTAFVSGDESRNIKGCKANGISEQAANILFDQMTDFAKYAFNKSHAAAYATVAYITAWLKLKYPLEYLCCTMKYIKYDKIPMMKIDLNYFGIKLLSPDINLSENEISISGNNIVFGLSTIKSIGSKGLPIIQERNKNGEFTSFKDFILRCKPGKTIVENLAKTGAFDSFSNNRSELIRAYGELKKFNDKVSEKEELLVELKKERENLVNAKEDEKEIKKNNRRIMNAENTLHTNMELFKNYQIDINSSENELLRLKEEKDLIGLYVSGHPLDSYLPAKEYKATPILDLRECENATTLGIVSNLRYAERKKDGKKMAFFDLEDQYTSIPVCVFTKAFAEYGPEIEEDAVIKLTGKVRETEVFGKEDEGEVELTFDTKSLVILQPEKRPIYLEIPSIMEWQDGIKDDVLIYQDRNGHRLILRDQLTGELRKTTLQISETILKDKKLISCI